MKYPPAKIEVFVRVESGAPTLYGTRPFVAPLNLPRIFKERREFFLVLKIKEKTQTTKRMRNAMRDKLKMPKTRMKPAPNMQCIIEITSKGDTEDSGRRRLKKFIR